MLIDSHAHLQDEQFADDLDSVLKNSWDSGLEKIVCIGYDYDSSRKAVELSTQYEQIYAVIGVHPHNAKDLNEEVIAKLFKLAKHGKVVAIGEIGLDYYRNLSTPEQQRKAFITQIKVAHELNKPVVIHDRDAHQEVISIIKKEKAGKNQGIMHCYSGHVPLALELMREGFFISIAGPVTYKNAKKTQEVAAKISISRLLIETDCPYLAPEPKRGTRNEPANVKYVAAKIAEIRRQTVEEISYQTNLNIKNVLNI
ncbi:MAG: TatD family hydrolase [Syntrophomonadaceae bacterium]|nr:TatD family hydrolase [Syntrophomonadaceae bacterium]